MTFVRKFSLMLRVTSGIVRYIRGGARYILSISPFPIVIYTISLHLSLMKYSLVTSCSCVVDNRAGLVRLG